MIYYGEKLMKSGESVEIVRTANGELELREKTGKLIRALGHEETKGQMSLESIIKRYDWTPTLMERYKMELAKPTRAEMFIQDLSRATGATASAVKAWVLYGKTTNDYPTIRKLEKLFGQSFETLFDKSRNLEVERKYLRHKRKHKDNDPKNEK